MNYERWCAMRGFGARLAGDTSPTAQERAEAKRARKAAKRRRDAALAALGQQASEARAIAETLWLIASLRGPLGDAFYRADAHEDDCRLTMGQIRRGEVVP